MTRRVKLGRIFLAPAAFHWAVQVGDTWYEITTDGGKKTAKRTKINSNSDFAATSGAGSLGGELAGETDKAYYEIDQWLEEWIDTNGTYDLTSTNCQKFAWEFMDWLTDGNFICPHRFDAANCTGDIDSSQLKTFARAEGGNAIARASWGGKTARYTKGMFNAGKTSTEVKVQAVAGPGLGAWAEASACRYEASIGNIVGAHFDPNVNTGAGIRNGNLDVHVLGFGGRAGADGVTLDTPVGGVSACSLM